MRAAGVGALLSGLVLATAALPSHAASSDRAASSAGAAALPETTWLFTGSGFGHGVGMSQYGAKAMADDGRSAAQILKYYYRGITVDRVRDNQQVHVNVVKSRPSVTLRSSAERSGGGEFTITVGDRTLTATPRSRVRVVRSGAQVTVSRTNGTTTVRASGPSAEVAFDDGRTLLSINGKEYLSGAARVVPASGGGLHAVMVVRLHDEYLDNLKEMPWGWPAAALQAQAAAARGYALRKVNRGIRDVCACHLHDGTSDQVFGTYPGANAWGWDRWKAAVRAGGTSTTGMVPRYGGALIDAVYSSSSGGRTQNNEEVFGGAPVPYLRSVDDPYSLRVGNPRRSWTLSVPDSTIIKAFGVKDVVTLEITGRTTAGGVARIVATSSSGTRASLTGEQMRRGLGLSSTYVKSLEPWPFFDVHPATNDFATEIAWLKGEGITTGYPDGNFGPRDRISREAVAAFLYRAAGEPPVTSDPDFTDVDASSKFAKEIAWLQDEGITNGHPDGSFGPRQRISREALAAFLYRAAGEPPVRSDPDFTDVDASSKFAKEIAWLQDEGITNGYPDGRFGPRDRISREAVAAFLYRVRDLR